MFTNEPADLFSTPVTPEAEKPLRQMADELAAADSRNFDALSANEMLSLISESNHLAVHHPLLSALLDSNLFWKLVATPPAQPQVHILALDAMSAEPPTYSVLNYKPLVGLNLYSFVDNPFAPDARLNLPELRHYASMAYRLGGNLVKVVRQQVEERLKTAEIRGFEKSALSRYVAALNDAAPFNISIFGLSDCLAALGLAYRSAEARACVTEILEEMRNVWEISKDLMQQIMRFSPPATMARSKQVSESVLPLLCPGLHVGHPSRFEPHAPLQHWAETVGKPLPAENTIEAWYELMLTSPYAYEESLQNDTLGRFPMQHLLQQYSAVPVALPFEFTTPQEAAVALPSLCEQARQQHCRLISWTIGTGLDACSAYDAAQRQEAAGVVERRPQVLECDVVRFQNNKEKWVAFVGLLDGRPYEIFTGLQDDDEGIVLPKSVMKGHIIKAVNRDGSHRYDFQFVNKRGYKTTVEGLSGKFNKEFWNYAKLISGVLRYRMPLETVIKLVGSMSMDDETINTWKTGVERALKKYVGGESEI